jgi:hypothetical protein
MSTINKPTGAKPILVVRFPKSFPNHIITEICSLWVRQIRDYHLIFIPESDVSRIEFECLNPSNPTKDLEGLTESLRSDLTENKSKNKIEILPL